MLKYNPLRTRAFLEDGESVTYRGSQALVFTPLKERPCPSREPGPDNYWRMFKTSDEQRKREEKKQRRDKRRGLALLRMEAEREKERAEEAFFVSVKQMIMEVE